MHDAVTHTFRIAAGTSLLVGLRIGIWVDEWRWGVAVAIATGAATLWLWRSGGRLRARYRDAAERIDRGPT